MPQEGWHRQRVPSPPRQQPAKCERGDALLAHPPCTVSLNTTGPPGTAAVHGAPTSLWKESFSSRGWSPQDVCLLCPFTSRVSRSVLESHVQAVSLEHLGGGQLGAMSSFHITQNGTQSVNTQPLLLSVVRCAVSSITKNRVVTQSSGVMSSSRRC